MPKLIVTTRDGTRRALDAQPGLSIMENVRDAGVDEMLALCGGCCACATCHVYVDSDFIGLLPTMSEEEDGMLEGTDTRRANSRLSCQLIFEERHDGIGVRIAED
ncbi:2Fe-2S iron-sulfur cluster-binding protein [Sphingomonas sp. SRS2]|uniref:2Fe-2S iron-sulfur cluster-binding protein n=1 Tax=Sphingomonas sp. SRS2 TaxID=133190 RepID=UPI00061842D1|nr:2Fe-2S iron-sulfur cluster-binding protein [Sphingomonas sp. SRS2]KKC24035.1 ferredoxin [Sphingomonas sp. SRS2]